MTRKPAAVLLVTAVLLLANGVYTSKISTRITGGKPAPSGRFSYSAMIFFEVEGDATEYSGLAVPLCAGVRIGRAAVLTTASCVYPFAKFEDGGQKDPTTPDFYLPNAAGSGGMGGQTERLRVTVGARPFGELDPAEEDWFDRGLPVRKVVVHPDFDVDNRDWAMAVRDNDIAIVYLQYAPPVDNTFPVAAISGVESNQDNWFSTNRTLAAMGWGVTNDAGAKASGLRYVEIKRQPDETCANRFKSHGLQFNRELMFCAASRSGTKRSSCLGDEGAAIIYNKAASGVAIPSAGPRGSDVVVGLTSVGSIARDTPTDLTQLAPVQGQTGADFTLYEKKCATNDKPFIYTKVSQYSDWIDQMNDVYNPELSLTPAIPVNDDVAFAKKIKCPSKNSVTATYNCYATTNDFLGRPTSPGCFGSSSIVSTSYSVAGGSVSPSHPNGNPADPAGSFQGVWFYLDIGPTTNAALQNKQIFISTCFSTFDTVLRAFKVNDAFNKTTGYKPTNEELDDCASISRDPRDDASDTSVLIGNADAYADDNIDNTAPGYSECNDFTDFLTFRGTESWELNGVRWYFLVTSSDKIAVEEDMRSFTSCGKAQLSCKSEVTDIVYKP